MTKRTQLNIRLERPEGRKIVYRKTADFLQGGVWKEINLKTGKVTVKGVYDYETNTVRK